MSAKQKHKDERQKQREFIDLIELPFEEIFNLSDVKFIWCKKCGKIYSIEEWLSKDGICPLPGCGNKKGIAWQMLENISKKWKEDPEKVDNPFRP